MSNDFQCSICSADLSHLIVKSRIDHIRKCHNSADKRGI